MANEPYEVELAPPAAKDVRKLKSGQDQVLRALDRLREDPDAGHMLTGVLKGARSLGFTVKGSGAFRAIYNVLSDRRVCLIMIVGPHENIYKEAERRLKALRRSGEL